MLVGQGKTDIGNTGNEKLLVVKLLIDITGNIDATDTKTGKKYETGSYQDRRYINTG